MATFLNDTMTEAGGGVNVVLTSHTGETGATWTAHPNNVGSMAIVKNVDRLRCVGSGNAKLYYASGTPINANYAVTCVMIRPGDGPTHTTEFWARLATGADTGYFVGVSEFDTPNLWYLGKHVAGVDTSLDTYAGSNSTATSYTVVFTLNGSALSVTFGGVEQMSATDGAITAAGRVGVGGFSASDSDTTGWHIDSISAADLVAGGEEHFGAASLDLTMSIAVSGKKTAKAAAAVPLTATIVTAGKKDAHGAASVPLTLGITTTAKKLARAAASVPLTLSVSTSAKRSTTGAADLPLTLTVGSAGKKTSKGATTVPLALDVTTAAKKNANAAADLPLTLTITTVGATGGSVTGASSLELTFGAAVSGKRRANAAASLPLTVSVSTAAKKNAHAVSTVPVALMVTTAAKRDAHAAASLALTLTIDSAGEEDVPRSRATAGSARTGWAATTARTRGTAGSGR